MLCVWHTIDVIAPTTKVRAFDEEEGEESSDDHEDKEGKSYNFEACIKSQALATKVYVGKKHYGGNQTEEKASNVYKVSNVRQCSHCCKKDKNYISSLRRTIFSSQGMTL